MNTRASLLLTAWLLPAAAFAYNEPPVNLGFTSFLDGGGGPPGAYLIEYLQDYTSRAAVDKDGRVVPGGARVSALVNLNQLFYMSPLKFSGANVTFDAIVPAVAVTARGQMGPGPVTANNAGVGDVAGGLGLQWNEHTLLGRPFFHRVEAYASFPTGSYNSAYSANPGSNLLSVEAYHAFTWHFVSKWETSWRTGYMYNGTNDAIGVRPGPVFHVTGALSREVNPKLRLGAVGYVMQQVGDDHVGGTPAPGSRERAFALGPGLVYNGPAGLLAVLNYPIEFGVENRFQGSRLTLQLILHL